MTRTKKGRCKAHRVFPHLLIETQSHQQTRGKIERWHRSLKTIIKLNNYYFPWELEQAIASFVTYYNHHRYHESFN